MTAFAPLLGLLEAVPDPRRAEGKVYRLPHVLAWCTDRSVGAEELGGVGERPLS